MAFGTPLHQAEQIERDCNEAIRAARRVTPRLLSGPADLEAAQQSPLFRGKLPPPEKTKARLFVPDVSSKMLKGSLARLASAGE